jgi:hypothetical protein
MDLPAVAPHGNRSFKRLLEAWERAGSSRVRAGLSMPLVAVSLAACTEEEKDAILDLIDDDVPETPGNGNGDDDTPAPPAVDFVSGGPGEQPALPEQGNGDPVAPVPVPQYTPGDDDDAPLAAASIFPMGMGLVGLMPEDFAAFLEDLDLVEGWPDVDRNDDGDIVDFDLSALSFLTASLNEILADPGYNDGDGGGGSKHDVWLQGLLDRLEGRGGEPGGTFDGDEGFEVEPLTDEDIPEVILDWLRNEGAEQTQDGLLLSQYIADFANDSGIVPPSEVLGFGLKVWKVDTADYAPGAVAPTAGLIDLTDGVGDPGPGFGNPANRYPWSMTVEGDDLFVGVLNGNALPLNLLFNVASLLDDPTQPLNFPTLFTEGPEIWRWSPDDGAPTPDGGEWERVLAPDDLPGLEGQAGVRELLPWDGAIYAATSNNLAPFLLQASNDPAELLVSTNGGDSWARVAGNSSTPDLFDNPLNSSVRTLEVINDELYVGTEVAVVVTALLGGGGPGLPAPELWVFSNSGPNPWRQIDDPVIEGIAISEILTIDDVGDTSGSGASDVIFGNFNGGSFSLYWYDEDIDDVIDITPTEFEYIGGGDETEFTSGSPGTSGLTSGDFDEATPFDDLGVIKLFQFDGYTYLGTVDYFEGASLMRSSDPTDPTSWELITTNGFYTERDNFSFDSGSLDEPDPFDGNLYIWSATEVTTDADGAPLATPELYIGTFAGFLGDPGQVILLTHDGPDDEGGAGVSLEFLSPDAFGAEPPIPLGDISQVYGIRSLDTSETTGELDNIFVGGSTSIVLPDLADDPYVPGIV